MRADRAQIWLQINSFSQPMGFELRVGDNAHALTLEDAARLDDVGEWLTARAVEPQRVPALIDAVGKLQTLARVLDERRGPEHTSAPAGAERAGHGSGTGRP